MTTDQSPRWHRRGGFADPARTPSFDVDWKYGRPGEQLVEELCGKVDSGHVQIEVKRKRRNDGKFYVETEHDPGRKGHYVPSGLSVTTAPIWAFAISDTGIVVMTGTKYLETALERNYGFPARESDGDCPTRGRLLTFWDLLAVTEPGRPSRAQFGDDFWWEAGEQPSQVFHGPSLNDMPLPEPPDDWVAPY